MYHDRVVGLIYLFVPHLLEYLIRAEHAARIGRQKIEDIEFDGRQLDLFPVNGHFMVVFVDNQSADGNRRSWDFTRAVSSSGLNGLVT